jgi:hypothetical protein
MKTELPESRAKKNNPGERGRPSTHWRIVLAAFFVTFLAMLGSIYWVIRTGKL